MDVFWYLFLICTFLGMIPVVMVIYSYAQGDKLPESRPSKYLEKTWDAEKRRPVLLFAGDSLTHGKIGVGYFNLLQEKYTPKYTMINAGINGDFCWNLNQRTEEMILCDPAITFILVGTNDAMTNLPIKHVGLAQRRKKLPLKSTHDWFESNLEELIETLSSRTNSRIVLLSIPTLGEDLESEAIDISSMYSQTIHELAQRKNLDYLPIHEQMLEYLDNHTSNPNYPLEKSVFGMTFALIRHYIFGKDWDKISNDSGQVLHIDHIHLNSTGARIIAASIEQYLDGLD